MTASSLLFFFVFAIVLVGVYIAIRRRLASVKMLAAAGIFGGIVSMTLFASAQDNVLIVHALLVGLVLGGGMSAAVITLAWYFLSQETRAEQKAKSSL